MPEIYLIDANIYVHRFWYSIPSTVTGSDGKPINAFIGFSNFLINLLRTEKPGFMMVAFDGKSSFRHRLSEDYKSNRPPRDPELSAQIDLCRHLSQGLGLCCLSSDEYEADDLIGTVGSHYKKRGFSCHYVSRDKDLAQLVRPGDWWWGGRKQERYDYEGVKKKFGVYPEQIADYLAVVGDSVDCIRGVPGAGEKTAVDLLSRYGGIERAFENGRSRSRIDRYGMEAYRRARELTRIVCDIPLTKSDLVSCSRSVPETEPLKELAQRTKDPNRIYDRWMSTAD